MYIPSGLEATPTGSNWPDRLQVRLSLAGASTNVGSGPEDLGDFTTSVPVELQSIDIE